MARAILGDNIVGKDGEKINWATVNDCDLIGLYFSAHWCPPCRGFTPVLAECYNKIKGSGKKFEIVFVSSDHNENSFQDYFKEMPWLALCFDKEEKREELSSKFKIRGIPSLILLRPDGSTATENGRGKVTSDPDGSEYPWGFESSTSQAEQQFCH